MVRYYFYFNLHVDGGHHKFLVFRVFRDLELNLSRPVNLPSANATYTFPYQP